MIALIALMYFINPKTFRRNFLVSLPISGFYLIYFPVIGFGCYFGLFDTTFCREVGWIWVTVLPFQIVYGISLFFVFIGVQIYKALKDKHRTTA
jgi:hypothetical protein